MFKKLAIAALLLLALATEAQAQSNCKYIAFGTVLTPGQWNFCFAAKNDTLGYIPLNKSGDNMLGKLITLAPATAAGFNLAPGSAPSSPVNGDLWATSSGLFARLGGSTVQVSTTGVVNTVPVTVNLNTASLQSAQTGSLFQGQQADGVVARAELDAFGAIASYTGVVAGGTKASPTAVTSGTQLTGINAYAYNGSAFVGPIVSFRTYAAENIASGHQGSKACLSTTPLASTILTDHLCQGADGGLTVGSPTGGDEGADTFNSAGNIFQNGVQVDTISNPVSLSNKTLASPTFSGTVAGANTIPLSILVQSAANTMLGNWTGSTANVTANVIPTCTDVSGNHLNYVAGTGITCGFTSSGTGGVPTYETITASGTYTVLANARELFIRCVGGGGGTGGTDAGANDSTAGGTGGTTTFNGINAIGGSGSTKGTTGVGNQPGAAGGTGGTGTASYRAPGSGGQGTQEATSTGSTGGTGGASMLGGGATSPNNGAANTGGGAGGTPNGTNTGTGSPGGGGGEYFEYTLTSLAASYSVTIGAGGTAGAAGTGGGAGHVGGSGVCRVQTFY